MLTRGEYRRAVSGGVISLAAILGFAGTAVWALIHAGWSGFDVSLFDPYLMGVLRFTVLQAVLSALLSVAVAVPFARALARQPQFPGRIWIVRLMTVPLGLPVITGALGLIAVWGRNGWANEVLRFAGLSEPVSIYGLGGILLAHVFFNFPLAARLFLNGLERLPGEYWLLSSNLGMSSLQVFRFIEWPQIRRQIPGIAGLILMLAATSFTLVLMLGGGPAATTLEVAIYQALRFDFDPGRAVALALLQIGLCAVLLLLLSLAGGRGADAITATTISRRTDGERLRQRMLDAFILFMGTAFVATPLASIVAGGVRADLLRIIRETAFRQALATSLALALPAGLLATGLSLLLIKAKLAQDENAQGNRFARMAAGALPSIASLILLFPATVLGTGWFLAVGPAHLTPLAPLLIIGVNSLMAFPFTLRMLDTPIAVHRLRTGRLAASLGIRGFARLRLIDWPVLRRPLLSSLSMGMALSLGDVGVIALLGNDNLVTLPWLLYSRMGSYRTLDAAGIALLLAILCLVLTLGGTGPSRENQANE